MARCRAAARAEAPAVSVSNGRRGIHGRRGGGRVASKSALIGFAFQVAQMSFKGRAQIAGRTLEFAHDLAEVPRQFRQFLGPEHHEGDHKHDN